MKFILVGPDPKGEGAPGITLLLSEFPGAGIEFIASPAGLSPSVLSTGVLPPPFQLNVEDVVLLQHPFQWAGDPAGWKDNPEEPELEGFEEVRRLTDLYPQTPFILITSQGSERLAVESIKAGVHDYVTTLTLPRLPAAVRTGLAQAEQKRQKHHQLYALARMILDASSNWEAWIGPHGEILHTSPACEKITGYTNQEFKANPRLIETIVHPEDLQKFADHGRHLRLAPRPTRDLEFRIRHRDGRERWISHSCHPLYHPDGQYLGQRTCNIDITERKLTELGLAQSISTFQTLVNSPLDVVVLLDDQARMVMVNETLLERRALRPDQVIGRSLWDIFPSKKEGFGKEVFERALTSGQVDRVFIDGFVGAYDVVLNPIRDAQGKVRHVAVAAHDITELKQAEEALFQRTEMLNTVVNNAPIGIVAFDQTGKIILAQGQTLAQMKLFSKDVKGQNVFELLKEEPALVEHLKRVLEGENFTGITEAPDGRVFEIRISNLHDSQEKISAAVGVAVDITEYKRIQDEIRRSKNQLEVILDGVTDGITALDPQGELIYANDAAAHMAGFPNSQVYLSQAESITKYSLRDEAGALLPLEQCPAIRLLEGNPNPPIVIRYQLSNETGEHWIQAKDSPIWDENGKLAMVVTIAHDITQIKQAEHDLQQAQLALENRIAERTLNLSQVNQELRNEIVLRRQAETELRNSAARAEALANVATRLNVQLDLQTLLQMLAEETLRALDYPDCCVVLHDEASGQVVAAAAAGRNAEQTLKAPSLPVEVYARHWLPFSPVMIIADIQEVTEPFIREIQPAPNIRTIIMVLMQSGNDFLGALIVSSVDEIRMPMEEEVLLLQALAEQAAAAIARVRLFQQVQESHFNLEVLSQKLVAAQEDERRRLGSELHDEIGQMLTLLGLNLEKTAMSAPLPADSQEALHEARQVVSQLLQQVRDRSLELRPTILDDLGLLPALLAQVKRFTGKTGIQVDLRHNLDQPRRYPAQIEITAFRMVQEALTNIIRHSGAHQAIIHLWEDGEMLGIQIEDDGSGFDLEELDVRASNGLSGMRERVILSGGSLDIDSQSGCGTCLTAEFPLSKA